MGVMSRRVVPVCGNLCCFCPSLRARSRQPVKRYKKLLADAFPRSQDAEPNDRMIGKLCEYASKNPLRIPKIAETLEQRFYKCLRNDQVGSVKVVLCIFRKLLSSCKEQMPLFASSLLGIIRTLLEQNRQVEIQVLGCNAIVDFINCQVDSTYMFNLEGLIPKLCQLAQEVGDDDSSLRLRTAGLQAVATMVRYMGEHSHISMDFDKIVSVTLENCMDLGFQSENGNLDADSSNKSLPHFTDIKQAVQAPLDASKDPSYWSRVCLHNMAGLAKEVTTVRRVLEPFFHHFDSEDYWSSEKGLACCVLMYLQAILEESGENSHLLLPILIKHLDHKNVIKQPLKQINILSITTQLAKTAKQQASLALTSALSDLMKHLRKCMLYSAEASSPGDGEEKLNADLQSAIEKCISQISYKVADKGPILDLMAVLLENLPSTVTVSKATVFSVYRMAQIVSSLPNISYHKKLLVAMAHPDHETRVGAHYVFSIVLLPTAVYPWSDQKQQSSLKCLGLPSVIDLQKERSRSFSITNDSKDKVEAMDTGSIQTTDTKVKQSFGESGSFKTAMTNCKKESASLRLSSHQISLLLSSVWVQAASPENTLANFVAIAHAYNIALLFAQSKASSHVALVRCVQLAFSLRSISLDKEGGLQPSRRRSLFTVASYMLIFAARSGNLPELVPIIKSSLTERTADPYLVLVDDIRLQAVYMEPSSGGEAYGSEDDDTAALACLSAIKSDEQQLKEIVMSLLISKFEKLPEDELFVIKRQLLQGFSLDDSYPLGAQLFMETPKPVSPSAQTDDIAFDEAIALEMMDTFSEENESESGRKTSLSTSSADVLSVNQLLDSVVETAQQVASLPVSSAHMPYDQVKNQCEALITDKQRKMSVLQSVKQQQEAKAIIIASDGEETNPSLPNTEIEDSEARPNLSSKEPVQGCSPVLLCSMEYGQQFSFRLPPASPYEKFLKAAGC
ncbi:hypothetical protein Ancab_012920 [Ancistrocladus abbreviatus]